MIAPSRPELVAALGEKCPYCGKRMNMPERPPTRDHAFRPVAKGGRLSHFNKVIVCGPCNQEKSDLSIWQWLRLLRRQGDRRSHRVLSFAVGRADSKSSVLGEGA